MEKFVTTLQFGLVDGCIFATMALALVIVYKTNRLLNFGQGEMATFSLFVIWQFTEWGIPVWGAIVLGLVASFVGGAIIERLFIRGVGDVEVNPLPAVIVTIGVLLALNGLDGFIWGRDARAFPSPFPDTQWDIGDVTINAITFSTIGVLVVEVVLLYLLFQRTKLGLGLRGMASNRQSSRLVGVPVGWMLLIAWGVAAAVGAMGAVLQVANSSSQNFDPNIMLTTLIFAFAAATLGGFDSLPGAVVGGLVVGLLTNFTEVYVAAIGPDLAVLPAFALILIVLTVRPQGLFGSPEVKRV